jgi:hypothetical protein
LKVCDERNKCQVIFVLNDGEITELHETLFDNEDFLAVQKKIIPQKCIKNSDLKLFIKTKTIYY